MLSDQHKHNELVKLTEIIDKTYAEIETGNFDTMAEIISDHAAIMKRLETEFSASPSSEQKIILMKASEKNQKLMALIQKKAELIKKELATNSNKRMITKAYVKNA